jgi:hypothetical protein
VSRKGGKPRERHGKSETAKRGLALSLLPMEILVGDRFTDHGCEWEVLTHPAALQGSKSLRRPDSTARPA